MFWCCYSDATIYDTYDRETMYETDSENEINSQINIY